jgi:hypothetical protein
MYTKENPVTGFLMDGSGGGSSGLLAGTIYLFGKMNPACTFDKFVFFPTQIVKLELG